MRFEGVSAATVNARMIDGWSMHERYGGSEKYGPS